MNNEDISDYVACSSFDNVHFSLIPSTSLT